MGNVCKGIRDYVNGRTDGIVTDGAKTQNTQVHYNINALNEAIAKQRWVDFKYYYYDVNKKKKYSYGGRA